MFAEIDNINRRWLASRTDLVADSALLLAQLDRKEGAVLQDLAVRITGLDSSRQGDVLRNPAFLKSLRELNASVLGAYKDDSAARVSTHSETVRRVHPLIRALEHIVNGDSMLPPMPSVEWIRLVIPPAGPLFDSGREYDVELDDEVDPGDWVATLRLALEFVRLHADAYKLLQAFVSYIVPLKQRSTVRNLSFSSRQLPNVIFKNNERSPFQCGETLVHEADHQFFYALEENYSFWDEDIRLQKAAYHSPWRDDPRPLDGILRGLSAFTRVAAYYSHVLPEVEGPDIVRVGGLLLQRIVECEDAASTLIGSGRLSTAGREYVMELACVLSRADSTAQQRSSYGEWRTDSMTVATEHRQNWIRTYESENSGSGGVPAGGD